MRILGTGHFSVPYSSSTIQTLQRAFGDENQLVQKEDLVNIPWEQGTR